MDECCVRGGILERAQMQSCEFQFRAVLVLRVIGMDYHPFLLCQAIYRQFDLHYSAVYFSSSSLLRKGRRSCGHGLESGSQSLLGNILMTSLQFIPLIDRPSLDTYHVSIAILRAKISHVLATRPRIPQNDIIQPISC